VTCEYDVTYRKDHLTHKFQVKEKEARPINPTLNTTTNKLLNTGDLFCCDLCVKKGSSKEFLLTFTRVTRCVKMSVPRQCNPF